MNIYILKLDYSYIKDNLNKILEEVDLERYERYLRCIDIKKGFSTLFSNLLLRYCISKELSLKEYEIFYNVNGKPYIKNSSMFFNISHSNDYITLAWDNLELGIDIEHIKVRNLDLMKRVFTKEEQDYVLCSENKIKTFYEIWTLKESYVKALGVGLHKDLRGFTIVPSNKKIGRYEFKTIYLEEYIISICSLNRIEEKIIKVDIRDTSHYKRSYDNDL